MNTETVKPSVNKARDAAVAALMRIDRQRWLPVEIDTRNLDHRDAQLARAIYRTVLQRTITLDMLLHTLVPRMTPAVRCILEAAAAQLLFLDRLPDYAVIDTAVRQAKALDKPAAGKVVNAVCRNIQRGIVQRKETGGWPGELDTLPVGAGYVRLGGKCRMKTIDEVGLLSYAASVPTPLVRAWKRQYGDAEAREMLLHGVGEAPTIVCGQGAADLPADLAEPHARTGFACWGGEHQAMVQWLEAGRDRWVQDPTSSLPAEATRGRTAQCIVDLCAGRGTKTRQLAMLHPKARVIATDIDTVRQAELGAAVMRYGNVEVVPFERIPHHAGRCDLLLLDVPCSNTGVLARRLEARHRYSQSMLQRMSALQRQIVDSAAPLLAAKCTVVYSTCSVEPGENADQSQWIAQRLGMTLETDCLTLPGGAGPTYHDGGYYAVLSRGTTSRAINQQTSLR